jgi:hypothetical protein
MSNMTILTKTAITVNNTEPSLWEALKSTLVADYDKSDAEGAYGVIWTRINDVEFKFNAPEPTYED